MVIVRQDLRPCIGKESARWINGVHMTEKPQVLVVGAGPVGLIAALRLRQRGVQVTIIDQGSRTAGHSYACALHPRSLELLDELGVGTQAMKGGRNLHTLAFYEGIERKAEVEFTDLPAPFPFVLVLPQSALETLLERQLAEQGGVQVCWNHRLSNLRCEKNAVVADIEKLAEPTASHSAPDDARTVQDKRNDNFRYIIGADGQHSNVREFLKIQSTSCGEGEAFVVYEFATDADLPHEVRVVLDEKTTNVMWPLSDNRCRWSFQLSPAEVLGETKVRRPLVSKPAEMENALARHAQKLLEQRAPWFKGAITEIEWWIGGYFERRLAVRFGQDRCWLAGDAAHRTSPIGVQSLNLGIKEAIDLADAIAKILREDGSPELLEIYATTHRLEWATLLKPGTVEQNAPVNAWTAKHRDRLLSSIPASGYYLDLLLHRLGLHVRATDSPSSRNTRTQHGVRSLRPLST
jgi:2-polyprenyl-6-methoxyphenol hydroxylase-like FAD-dependent oxidoreductase